MPEMRALASVQDHVLLGHGEVVKSYRSLLLRALLRERSFRIGALIIGFVTALSLLSLNRGADGKPLVSPSLVVVLIITLFSWTYFARLTRGLVLVLRRSPLVEAAQTIGASKTRIIVREILPNIAPVILVYWAVQLPTNIIAEATLSFLGVGVQAPQPSWGNMIAEAQRSSLYQLQPWFLLGPGIALFLTVAGFNKLSAGLRNVLDPHRRGG
ncbi:MULTISPECIES: ABC transporter permease [Mesorhizobium]|uniref:ABC transporter permease n=1 Tax=Mesorhizobium TaxID=68287 RepID=UPI0010A965E9|nr:MULTISPECIES: ABC transporter permease [Mesorhizobium]